MTWCSESNGDQRALQILSTSDQEENNFVNFKPNINVRILTCPSCGHNIHIDQDQRGLHDLPGLPAGVKFDPNDQEILQHLEAKFFSNSRKLHPLTDEFIPTIEGENGICYTHPQKLPGISKDGQIRHYFHKPSKAYTTGTRKRRKVQSDTNHDGGGETRWHKTGKTRPVVVGGQVKGYKKILVLYTNDGRQKKPEKTNWVMHQYHLGDAEDEKDGELVLSKVFYQTQPRQCSSSTTTKGSIDDKIISSRNISYYNSHFSPHELNIPNLIHNGDGSSSFIHHLPSNASKGN